MSALDLTAQHLWVPGQGLLPPHIRDAQQAVKDYDCDLSIGRHEQSGEWVILLQRGGMERPHPVFGLGPELPSRERIMEMLYKGDVRRHGGELVNKIMRSQDARQKALRDEVNDQTGVAAEALEWAYRKSSIHASPRIFVPGERS